MLTFIVSVMIVRETCIQKTKTFQCHIYKYSYVNSHVLKFFKGFQPHLVAACILCLLLFINGDGKTFLSCHLSKGVNILLQGRVTMYPMSSCELILCVHT